MRDSFLAFILLTAVFLAMDHPAVAQRNHFTAAIGNDKVDFTISQPFFPYSDSGQWVPAEIDLTNNLSTPDSIWIGLGRDELSNRWCWSFGPDSSNANSHRLFLLPPHSQTPDVRLAAYYHCPYPINDTELLPTMQFTQVGQDSLWERRSPANLYLTGRGNCADFSDNFLSSMFLPDTMTAIIGGDPPRQFQSTDFTPKYCVTTLTASFHVVGEYSDSFVVMGPSRIVTDSQCHFSLNFSGAPQYLVHDTIIGTYSNCLWTHVERYPIIGRTTYQQSHSVRFSPDTAEIPFLDQVPQQMIIRNITGLPLEAYDFSDKANNPYEYLGSWPQTLSILPYDSASVTLEDQDYPEDDLVQFHFHCDTIHFKITSLEQPQMISDTVDKQYALAYTNVYCPEYFSYPPELAHDIRPAGIIFYYTDAPFRTVYGNLDTENYEFFQPYYDDPHFSISIDGVMPRIVTPALGDWMYATTSYTGDSKHTLRTQLHWPRIRVRDGIRDTINIDVLAVGPDAPPYRPTLSVQMSGQKNIHLWPNPARTMLIVTSESSPSDASILDALGREVERCHLDGDVNTIDISQLQNGAYWMRVSGRTLPFLVNR